MDLFNKIRMAMETGQPFSVVNFEVVLHRPTQWDVEVAVIAPGELGKLGYILQWWAARAIYNTHPLSFTPRVDGSWALTYKYGIEYNPDTAGTVVAGENE